MCNADQECVPLPDDQKFVRGDADGSERIDISDAIFTLYWLFLGGKEPGCKDAADSDDSGTIDISDAIHTLGFLFLGNEPPPDPGPEEEGPDSTEDGLGCEQYPASEDIR